jgi:hypothetical protein
VIEGDSGHAASPKGGVSAGARTSTSGAPHFTHVAAPASLQASQAEQTGERNERSPSTSSPVGNANPQTSQRSLVCSSAPHDTQCTCTLPVLSVDEPAAP